MSNDFKLVVLDIDGTLLRDDLKIGERTIDAIQRAYSQGVKFTFATGRMVSACRDYLAQSRVELPIIALNGSLVKSSDSKMPVYHEPIPAEFYPQIAKVLSNSSATVCYVDVDSAFGWNIEPTIARKLASWIVDLKEVDNGDLSDDISIFLIAGEENDVKQTYSSLIELNIPVDTFIFPSIRYYPMWYIEVRAKGTNKGKGLRMLRESLNMRKEEVLVVGDYVNDIPMFDEAGTLAVVSNAHPDLKKLAHYESPYTSNEDAIAEILEKLVIKE